MISNAFVSPVLARDVMTSRQHQNMHYRSIPLSAQTPDGNEKTNTSPSARERGIYARPSAAIEKGSGFFIPGLEGKKECMQKYCTCLLYLYESIQCTSPLDICVPPHRPVNCTLRKQNHISSFRGWLDSAIAMSQSINHPGRRAKYSSIDFCRELLVMKLFVLIYAALIYLFSRRVAHSFYIWHHCASSRCSQSCIIW